MKASTHQAHLRRTEAGFTLLELSAAMAIMLVLATALVAMMQQHVRFMEMFKRQTFLSTEAPQIGNLLGRILNKADHYFVYASKEDAQTEGQPVLASGPAVRLFFKSANQETTARVIAVEDTPDGAEIRFYSQQPDDSWTSWIISDRIGDAAFRSDQGILNMTLDGPNGEQITYSGGAR